MTLFRRGGVYWYDFQVNGTRIRESTGLRKKSDAGNAEALRKAELVRGFEAGERNGRSPRFSDFAFQEFAPWSENEHREHPSTHERYLRSLKVLVSFFGNKPLNMIQAAEVERFKLLRSKQRRKYAKDGRVVTPAAVNRDLAVLRILFNFAVRLENAKANPMVGVRLLPENNLQIRVISWEEEAMYLAGASQPLRDVAILMLETGMRPGEVFQLRRSDVDLDDRFLQIPKGKTPLARRTIPLTRRARELLDQRIQVANCKWLFPGPSGQQPIGSVRKAHEAAVLRAGIAPHFRLYDLRHTALTRMAMAGIDLSTLRELAGHANIQMTMRYLHPTPQHKVAAIEKLEMFQQETQKNLETRDTAAACDHPRKTHFHHRKAPRQLKS